MNTRKMVLTALFISINLIFPQLIHFIGGPGLGSIILPMHIPVFIGAMLLGKYSGSLIAIISVMMGLLLFNMPPLIIASYMVFELTAYAFVSGYLSVDKNINPYISYIIAKMIGMITALVVTIIIVDLLGISAPAFFGSISMFTPGLIGIGIQLAIIPIIVIALKKVYHNELS